MNNIEYCISRYFIGMKAEVGIPLPNSETFRDWAIINEIDEDLVSLQLSRDILPDGVSLRVGQLLTIRSEIDGQVNTCRCFIVSMGYNRELLLRLTSEIFSGESREFYRIDAFLPINHHVLYDQNPANVKKQWEARRKWRQNEKRVREVRRLEAKRENLRNHERARKYGLPDDTFSGDSASHCQGKDHEQHQDNLYDELLPTAKTVAVTISGGGLKIATNQKFNRDDLVLLEIFVPSSRIIVDVVARVVFSDQNDIAGEDRNFFNAGMQFVFIDESARLAISSHIGSIQLRRIRQFKGFTDVEPLYIDNISKSDKHFAYIDGVDVSGHINDGTLINRESLFQQVALGLLFVCIISLISYYYSWYAIKHPKNDIENIFEHGITLRGSMTTHVGLSGSGS